MASLRGRTVAVSTSEVDAPATHDGSPFHQRGIVAELARQLFALEARIAYGGDLRETGFTRLLVEVQRAHASSAGATSPGILSYIIEPLSEEERASHADAVEFIDVMFFDFDRAGDDSASGRALGRAMSLRAMRWEIARDATALVAVGGRTSGYAGWRPGIADEIAAAVKADKPIYLVGGFGGAAGWYANAAFLEGGIPNAPAAAWLGAETTGELALPEVDEVVRTLRGGLSRNGLTKMENALLARTVNPDEIVALVVSGLARVSG
jgi:SLOG cluster2